jgi:hypothetical protein
LRATIYRVAVARFPLSLKNHFDSIISRVLVDREGSEGHEFIYLKSKTDAMIILQEIGR